jgi:hypothetical protein
MKENKPLDRSSVEYSKYISNLQKELYEKKRNNDNNKRYYEHVLYKEKDLAKKMGARWDAELKKWYFINQVDRYNFLSC